MSRLLKSLLLWLYSGESVWMSPLYLRLFTLNTQKHWAHGSDRDHATNLKAERTALHMEVLTRIAKGLKIYRKFLWELKVEDFGNFQKSKTVKHLNRHYILTFFLKKTNLLTIIYSGITFLNHKNCILRNITSTGHICYPGQNSQSCIKLHKHIILNFNTPPCNIGKTVHYFVYHTVNCSLYLSKEYH